MSAAVSLTDDHDMSADRQHIAALTARLQETTDALVEARAEIARLRSLILKETRALDAASPDERTEGVIQRLHDGVYAGGVLL